jgi:hypothetical protein
MDQDTPRVITPSMDHIPHTQIIALTQIILLLATTPTQQGILPGITPGIGWQLAIRTMIRPRMLLTTAQDIILDNMRQTHIVVSLTITQTHIIKITTTLDLAHTLTDQVTMQEITMLDMAITLTRQDTTLMQRIQEITLLDMALTPMDPVPTLIQRIQEITLLALAITLTRLAILQETTRLVPRSATPITVRPSFLVVLPEMLGQKTPEDQVQLGVLGESSLLVGPLAMPATR